MCFWFLSSTGDFPMKLIKWKKSLSIIIINIASLAVPSFFSIRSTHRMQCIWFSSKEESTTTAQQTPNDIFHYSVFTNHFETILTIVINTIVSLFKVLPAQQAHSLSLDDFYNSDWDADGQQRALHAILVRLLFRCVLSSYAFGARPDPLCSRL